MKFQILSSRKNKIKYFKMSSVASLPSMLSINREVKDCSYLELQRPHNYLVRKKNKEAK